MAIPDMKATAEEMSEGLTRRRPAARLLLLGVVLVGVAALLLGCSESGEVRAEGEGSSPPSDTLTVLGTATVLAAPDEAVLTVSVENEAPEAAAAGDENAKRTQAVLDRLKAEGLTDEAIETASISVFPVEEFDGEGKPRVRSYRAQNTLRVTITKLDTVGRIYAAVLEAGANNVQGPEWRLSDDSVALQEALGKAVAAARGKAEALAQAAEAEAGEILSLREEAGFYPPIYSGARATGEAAADVAEPPVQEQQLTVSASVTAVYKLER